MVADPITGIPNNNPASGGGVLPPSGGSSAGSPLPDAPLEGVEQHRSRADEKIHPLDGARSVFNFVSFVPMPFNQQLEVSFQQGKEGKVKANLFDAVGRLVYTEEVAAHAGLNTFHLDLVGYPSGLYFLSLNNGETVIGAKLIKE